MRLFTTQELKSFNEIKFDLSWSYKELFAYSLILYTIIFSLIIISLSGCSAQPKVIVKHDYIEKPVPKLQTVPIKDLNLSKDKVLKLHIKVKEK